MLQQAREETELARRGDFEEIQRRRPDRYLFANNKARLMIAYALRKSSTDNGIDSIRLSVAYMLNYAFVTTRQPGELLIVKNRHGTQGGAMDVLREALMVRDVESAGDDRVKINISDDDRVMLRLRGLHI